MNTNKNPKPRYEVLACDGQAITSKTVTHEQVMAISHQSADYFLSSVFGIWAFRTAEDEWIEHHGGDWPGFGDVCIRIVQALQLNPGEFLDPVLVAELTGRPKLRENNTLSARLMAIRKAHKESYKKPHLFLSRKAGGFAISWNPKCSWMWIERIPPAIGVTD
jgi:hypothetical protein